MPSTTARELIEVVTNGCAASKDTKATGVLMPWKHMVTYARRMDGWPLPFVWVCGVPDCRHKYWIVAWFHAAWRLRRNKREEAARHVMANSR